MTQLPWSISLFFFLFSITGGNVIFKFAQMSRPSGNVYVQDNYEPDAAPRATRGKRSPSWSYHFDQVGNRKFRQRQVLLRENNHF